MRSARTPKPLDPKHRVLHKRHIPLPRNSTSLQILIIQARAEISDALNEANRLCTFAAGKALELEELEKELAEMMR